MPIGRFTMKYFLQYREYFPYLREHIVELVLIAVTWYLLGQVCLSKYREWRKLPPGPMGLPIVGYLPFLGDKPHETLAQMSKTYGKIIGLRFGLKYVVVLNEFNLLKEGLSHPSSFNRPRYLLGPLKLGFGVAGGQEWSEQRNYVTQVMRKLGMGRGPWETQNQESTKDFVKTLRTYEGRPVLIREELLGNLANNMMSFLYGKRFRPETEKEEIQTLAGFSYHGLKYYGSCSPSSFIPGLHKLCELLGIADFRRSSEYTEKYVNIAKKEIEKHWFDEDCKNLEDFNNLYKAKMEQMKNSTKKHFFTEDNMLGNATAIFHGSTDTTTSSILTLFRLMARYPDIQKKVQDELDEVIGKEGSVSYEERFKVPYTFAVILEAQRVFCLAPLSTTRELSENIDLGGYHLPKGSLLTGNMWAVHNDPEYWKDPHLFQPERFLTEEQKLEGIPERFVAFSIGKRKCVGETVALMVLLSIFTTVMQNFNISYPPGEEKDTFVTSGGIVAHLTPKPLCFIERP